MAAKRASTTPSKSDFIRSLPRDTPADSVVAQGKARGLTFDKNYVYKTRARDAKAGNGPRRRPGRQPSAAKGVAHAAPSAGGALEKQLVALALELGLGRAQAVIEQTRSRLRSILS